MRAVSQTMGVRLANIKLRRIERNEP